MFSPWKKSPNVQPRTKNKAWIFVNSFSFSFLEFLAKIYWANFFPWAEKLKKGRYTGNQTGLAPGTGWAGRPSWIGPGGPVAVSPQFFLKLLLFDFLLQSQNFKGSLNKEIEVLGFSFSDYLFSRVGSSGIHPIKHTFAPTMQPWRPRGA
jgi:hypothetical protein